MKKVLPMLLDRDNHKCGIHYGGCGQDIKQEDIDSGNVNVDHIIPKTILKHKGNLGDSVFMKDYFRQATHANCNSIDKRGQLTNYPEFTCDCHYTYFNVETDTVELYFQHQFKHNGTMEWRNETFSEGFISPTRDQVSHKKELNIKIIPGKKGNWRGFRKNGDMGSIFPIYKTSDLYICRLLNILSLLKCKRIDESKKEYFKYIEFTDREESYSAPDSLDKVNKMFDSLSTTSDTKELWFEILYILNPKEYHYRISDEKYQSGDIIEQIKHLHKAIALESKKSQKISEKYSNLGYAYFCVANYEESEKYLLKAVEYDPNNKYAKGNLSYLYEIQGRELLKEKRYQPALNFFLKAKDIFPDSVLIYSLITYTYSELGNLVYAIRYAKEGLKISPDTEALKQNLRELKFAEHQMLLSIKGQKYVWSQTVP